MNLDTVILNAYSHFLEADPASIPSIYRQYAIEELRLSGQEAESYNRLSPEENEEEIQSPDFDRFYIWYYINYIVDPVINPGPNKN